MNTQENIISEIDNLINSLKKDWSKWGDLSDYIRDDTIIILKNIKLDLQEKLIIFEKYFRSKPMGLYIKKNMVEKFHTLFKEEMKGTPTGDKFLKKEEQYFKKLENKK